MLVVLFEVKVVLSVITVTVTAVVVRAPVAALSVIVLTVVVKTPVIHASVSGSGADRSMWIQSRTVEFLQKTASIRPHPSTGRPL